MATRLEVLEDKNRTLEEKALVLEEMTCKAIRKKVEGGCPHSCDKCLQAIKECLSEDVGDLS